METRLAHPPDDLADVLEGYWTLWDERLRCHPQFTVPTQQDVQTGRFEVIMCYDGDDLVGLMCVKPETNGIYYPVMKGDMAKVLAEMCKFAQEHYPTLTATTDNQLIHELTIAGGRPFTYDENHTIHWSK